MAPEEVTKKSSETGRFIMVRHGESEGNRDRRFTISSDVPLTELGRRQAFDAARRIKLKFKPDRIISSPFARAADQRDYRGGTGSPRRNRNELHERDLGALKGHSYDLLREVVKQDPLDDPTTDGRGGPRAAKVTRTSANA